MAKAKNLKISITESDYARLRIVAKRFERNHFLGYVDADDYTQEAALATWRGRRKPKSAMIDHFRTRAPLTRGQFREDPTVPVEGPLEDWFEEMACSQDPETLVYMSELYHTARALTPAAWALEFPGISQNKVIDCLEEIKACMN